MRILYPDDVTAAHIYIYGRIPVCFIYFLWLIAHVENVEEDQIDVIRFRYNAMFLNVLAPSTKCHYTVHQIK